MPLARQTGPSCIVGLPCGVTGMVIASGANIATARSMISTSARLKPGIEVV